MTHIPRLICFCGNEMKNNETGVTVEATLVDQGNRPHWKAFGDRWVCADCGSAVFRLAAGPCALPHDEDYETRFVTNYEAQIRG